MGELGNPFYYKVAAGIEKELAANGFALLVATTDDTAEGEERVADALLAQRVGALLLIPVADDQSYLEGERHLGTPVIAIDRPARNLVADSIVLENHRGVYDATTRLLARGHRRIGYVCNPASVYTQSERLRGYRDALAAYGIHDSARWERLVDDLSVRPDGIVEDLLSPTTPRRRSSRATTASPSARSACSATATTTVARRSSGSTTSTRPMCWESRSSRTTPWSSAAGRRMLAIERIRDPSGFTRQIELPTWIVERGTGERPPQEETA